MAELSIKDFAAYFEAVHGSTPFPWQVRLLEEVAQSGKWPALLDLPTGSGKTAALDVAVFHLALDAQSRSAPRRIVMVVDRRTVVDQAFERAKKIAAKLDDAKKGVLEVVAARLQSLSGTKATLATAQLRGGMPRDDGWTKRPDQPLVAVSTVDQVGSRLLFRGYGVSEGMRSIHAGLLGNDTLILLDEVHLSQPFRETLGMLRGYRRRVGSALPDRWQIVEMSATPGSEDASRFRLADEDRRDPELARRLQAAKPAQLPEPVKASGGEEGKRAAFVKECVEQAAKLATPGRVVGVVVNRVATARAVATTLRERPPGNAQVFLVTGRMRPLDRDALDGRLGPLVRSGRPRDPKSPPLIVVSTQCIEAGADYDFDALVTECASIDALRQRFGRLNRMGDIDDARGVILVRADAVGKDDSDPIYGEALARTWLWLNEAPRDFGIEAMDAALPKYAALERLRTKSSRAPVMLPAHLDLWSQTKPTPQPDPDVSLWLHGVDQEQDAEVQVVWRADLTEALLRAAMEEGEEKRKEITESVIGRLEVCPPVGLEALSVPVYVAREWLAGEAAGDVADVEGRAVEADEEPGRAKKRAGRAVLLWNGDESRVIRLDEVRAGLAGATIVVPSTYGGVEDGTWDPSSKLPVPDLGDFARWKQSRRATLRLDTSVHPAWGQLPPLDGEDDDIDDRTRVIEWLVQLSASPEDASWLLKVRTALRHKPAIVRLEAVTSGAGEELASGYLAVVGRGRAEDASTEGDSGSHTGVEVTLDAHMKGVADWAQGFAERCGLPAAVVNDLKLAGRWHDAGKVDPRFQQWLHGGSAFKAEIAPVPLAKSTTVAADRAELNRARERSGYPKGARHELASVSLLQTESGAWLLDEAADRELVLHLVASHHGWCRPFAPVVPDPKPLDLLLKVEGGAEVRASSKHGLERLDSGIAERFWRLTERYGWFGLAWLEAILRLSDHRRSEQEQQPNKEEA